MTEAFMQEVKDRMTRMELKLDTLHETQTNIRVDIGALKVKAGVWGALGGSIPVVIGLGLWLLRSQL